MATWFPGGASWYDPEGGGYSIPNISNVGDYTVAFWFYVDPNNYAGAHVFGFDNYNNTPRHNCFFRAQDPAKSRIQMLVDGTGDAPFSTNDTTESQWSSCVLVRDGTSGDWYINGTSEASTITLGSGTFTMENIRIGCYARNDIDNYRWFKGAVAEFMIDGEAWDAGQRAAFDAGISPRAVSTGANILAYCPLVRPNDTANTTHELIGGTAPEVTTAQSPGTTPQSPTAYPHPPIIYNPEAQIIPFPSSGPIITSVSTDDIVTTTENPWVISGSGFGNA